MEGELLDVVVDAKMMVGSVGNNPWLFLSFIESALIFHLFYLIFDYDYHTLFNYQDFFLTI